MNRSINSCGGEAINIDFVCRCGPFCQDDLEYSIDKCPHCGNFIPVVVWENDRLRKNGESDLLDVVHNVLSDGKPLFSGAR